MRLIEKAKQEVIHSFASFVALKAFFLELKGMFRHS